MAFDRIAMDILGPLPLTKSGNKYIIVFSDYRTKWPEAACLPSIEAHKVARSFFDLIITRHGAPHTLLSDRGANFLSQPMHEIYLIMNVKKLNTSSYRPQTDGLVEKFNSTLTQSLTMYCNSHQTDWDDFIPGILFGYHTSISSSTEETPFFLLYGRWARLPMDVRLLPPSKLSADNSAYRSIIVKNLALAQKWATDHNYKQQQTMKQHYDKKAAPTTLQEGQQVLVHNPTKKKGLSKKLSYHYDGPYTLAEQKSPVQFAVQGMPDRKANLVHVNRMKAFPEATKHALRTTSPLPPPAPVSLPESPIADAAPPPPVTNPLLTPTSKRIIKHRRRQRHLEYLIQEDGEPSATAIWVPSTDITDTTLIDRYLKQRDDYPLTRTFARSRK